MDVSKVDGNSGVNSQIWNRCRYWAFVPDKSYSPLRVTWHLLSRKQRFQTLAHFSSGIFLFIHQLILRIWIDRREDATDVKQVAVSFCPHPAMKKSMKQTESGNKRLDP